MPPVDRPGRCREDALKMNWKCLSGCLADALRMPWPCSRPHLCRPSACVGPSASSHFDLFASNKLIATKGQPPPCRGGQAAEVGWECFRVVRQVATRRKWREIGRCFDLQSRRRGCRWKGKPGGARPLQRRFRRYLRFLAVSLDLSTNKNQNRKVCDVHAMSRRFCLVFSSVVVLPFLKESC